ncbi:MAG: beta-ketoacyl-[acyl-carrier-protein] synthase family protein [Allosphingosinicella sp.]
MNGRRVVVTGLGTISALGLDARSFWTALIDGRGGIRPLRATPTEPLRFTNGAEVSASFSPSEHFEARRLDLLDRFAQFALMAAREAVASSGLDWAGGAGPRVGVVTGSCLGGQDTEDQGFADLYGAGVRRFAPHFIPKIMASAGTSQISMEWGIEGPSFTITTACASSGHAIGLAFQMVRSGILEAALAGGSEAPFSNGHLRAWDALRVVSPGTCRPFCRERDGMILGEGGAMLVLEPLEAARRRNAPIIAEIVGFGMSADAHHPTQPWPPGAARAIAACLADAKLAPDSVGHVNAHGTATPSNDPAEAQALRLALGEVADRVSVTSTKSAHGHLLGAAGAVEAVATVLSLLHQVAPPTLNFGTADPSCDLNVVANESRPARIDVALCNSFAFGGLNAVLAFRRFD